MNTFSNEPYNRLTDSYPAKTVIEIQRVMYSYLYHFLCREIYLAYFNSAKSGYYLNRQEYKKCEKLFWEGKKLPFYLIRDSLDVLLEIYRYEHRDEVGLETRMNDEEVESEFSGIFSPPPDFLYSVQHNRWWVCLDICDSIHDIVKNMEDFVRYMGQCIQHYYLDPPGSKLPALLAANGAGCLQIIYLQIPWSTIFGQVDKKDLFVYYSLHKEEEYEE